METTLLVALVLTLAISWGALLVHTSTTQADMLKEIDEAYTRGYRRGREYERGLNQ